MSVLPRVLLFHNSLWAHYKAKVFTHLVATAQQEGSVEVIVVHLATTEKVRLSLSTPDLTAHQYPYRVLFEQPFETIASAALYQAMWAEIIRTDPAVVCLPGYNHPAYWRILFRLAGSRRLLVLPVDSTYYDHPRIWYKESFKRLLLQMVDLVFCYGQMQRQYLTMLGVSPSRIYRRIQATDNKRLLRVVREHRSDRTGRQHQRRFLYVGRLDPEKNLLHLLAAYRACNTDWELVLVGDGSQRPALEAYAEQYALSGVRFVGALSWSAVATHYADADVFVLPSSSEPWGLVVNEAMLCQLPVLVSTHCGCSLDLVESGGNGFLFPPSDTQALTKLLRWCIDNQDRLAEMGKRSAEIIAYYEPQRAAAQMLGGFHRLLDLPPPLALTDS